MREANYKIVAMSHYLSKSVFIVTLFFCLFLAEKNEAQNIIQVGNGIIENCNTCASPINIYYESSRGQVIYTQAELIAAGGAPGLINKLGFDVTGIPDFALPNFTVRLGHTSVADTTSFLTDPTTLVYTNPSYLPSLGFDLLTLDAPFVWNGVDNILVEMCFDPVPEYTSSGILNHYSPGPISGFNYYRDDGVSVCGDPTDDYTGLKPNIQFELAAQAANDAGIYEFNNPVNFCAGNQDIQVTVKNYGINIINTLDVNWEFDGVLQTPFSLTTPLDTLGGIGSQEALVTIGNKNFVLGNSHDIKIWTSNPNMVQDSTNANDTISFNLGASIAGTFTIGGAAPDYTSFQDAIENLNDFGVCGPVVFNVRDGVYDEQVEILNILGASSVNTITFQSESGDSTLVTLQTSATSFANYTIQLNNSKYITFKGMTLAALNASYGRVVNFSGVTNYNCFESCVFQGIVTTSTSSNFALFNTDSNSDNRYVTFHNNHFKNGSYALIHYGFYDPGPGGPAEFQAGNSFSGSPDQSLVITDNIFENQYRYGVYTWYNTSPLIRGNEIFSNSTNGLFYGIYVNGTNGGLYIEQNKVNIDLGGYGIYLNQILESNIDSTYVANNFVSIGGQSTATGIYLYNVENIGIYNNNVNIYSTSTSSSASALRYSATYGSSIQNNVLVNQEGGYSMYGSSSSGTVVDYNDLYSPSGNFVYSDGTTYSDLASIQAIGLNTNGISEDPLYTSLTDLHVEEVTLNKTGLPITVVTEDIDGEPRNANTPDIGADEFTAPALDMAAIEFISPTTPFTPGQKDISIDIRNQGEDTITALNIEFTLNGVAGSTFNWTGSLATGASETVIVSNELFELDSTYSITAWTSLPNGMADLKPLNDTISIENLTPALSGVFTIGGTTPDYPDFTSAVNDITIKGVAGSIVFNVRPGVYTEQLVITSFPGAECGSNIVFQSEDGDSTSVTLTFAGTSAANYVVLLDGVDGITFRNMTFSSAGTYARIFDFRNGADCNTLSNNQLLGVPTGSTGDNRAIVYGNGFTNFNNTFQNNLFSEGSHGIYFYGASGNTLTTGLRIENNLFLENYYFGLYITYMDGTEILGNEFIGTSSYSAYRPVYVRYSEQNIKINNNKITSDNHGIGLYYCNPAIGEAATVANNVVVLNGTGLEYGFYIYNSDRVDMYYNTINVNNTNSGSNAIYAYSAGNINIHNNNLVNTGGGYVVNNVSSFSNWEASNNNLYTTGPYIAYNASTPIETLADYQTATGEFENCYSVNPQFVSTTDLHSSAIDLNGNGIPLAGFPEDYDGNPRDLVTPDIGAFEFSPPPTDAGLTLVTNPTIPFLEGNQDVYVALKNFGGDTLTAVEIEWEYSTFPKQPVSWSGNLPSGDTTHVFLGVQDFSNTSLNVIKAWTSIPNGVADMINVNDTIVETGLNPALTGTYTIGGGTPDFDDFTEAANALANNGILDSVIFNVRSGTYAEQIQIGELLGSGCDNPITFQSESGNASSVTLTFGASSSNNYVVQLDGAQGVNFRNMTIHATNSTYATAISLINGASCNEFTDNEIIGANTTSTSTNRNVITINASTIGCDDNVFRGNSIENGSNAIYLNGNSTDLSSGLIVENNEITNQYYRGIYLSYMRDFSIAENTIIARDIANSGYTGLEISSTATNSSIRKNIITSSTGFGLELSSASATLAEPMQISNNMISIGGSNNNCYGLYLRYSSNVKLFHNSVHLVSNSVSSIGFYTFSNSSLSFNNNSFSLEGLGLAFDWSGNYTADYNNYYSTAANLGELGGNLQVDLPALQVYYSQDQNSVSVDPDFLSATDLHTTQISLNGTGTPITEVTEDIDGDARDTSNPDIGADEFTPTLVDAKLNFFTNPVSPIFAGTRDVEVELYNNGVENIDSVTVFWSVDGNSQPPFFWTDTTALLSGTSSNFKIGDFTFSGLPPFNITAWVDSPNGQPDQNSANDTIFSGDLYVGLAGDYFVGGANSDFNNFTEVASALNTNGIADDVNFIVRPGIYNEQVIFTDIPGNTADRPITFYSETADSSSVTINNNTAGTVTFDGVKYMTFQNIGFANTSGRNVIFSDTTSNITFEHCLFQGRVINSTSSTYANLYLGSATINDLVLRNNTIKNGSSAIYFDANFSHSTGLVIEENDISDFYYRAMYISEFDASLIRNNTISSYSIYGSKYGIYCNSNDGAYEISGNKIELNSANSGIYLGSCGNGAFTGSIFNNFVQAGGTSTTYGIRSVSNQYQNYYHNSVNVTSTGASTYALYLQNNTNINVINNILANSGTGYAFYTNSTSSITSSDYNDLFTGGATLGFYNGDQSDLSAWQLASTHDLNSFSVDPMFAGPTDLHVSQANLDGNATPIATITIDIDGQLRNETNPDIGADEFGAGLAVNDGGVVAILSPVSDCDLDTLVNVTVRIQNFGTDTLTGFDIAFSINDTLEVIENVGTLSIPGGTSTPFTFSTQMRFDEFDLYSFNAYTLLAADSNIDNDSLGVRVLQRYPSIQAMTSPDETICQGQYAYFNGSGGSTYRWRYIPGGSIFSYSSNTYRNPSVTTSYELEAISVYGCSSRDTITINVDPRPTTPTITQTGTFSTCSDDTIVLTSSIAENIFWNTGAITPSIFVTQPGYYSVTHTDTITGCTAVSTRTISGSPTPYLSGPTSICEGSSATISVINGSTYLWNTGAVSSGITVSPTTSTTYSVTVTNSQGCTFVRSRTISVSPVLPPPVIVDITEDTSVCYGKSIRLEVMGNATNYNWSNGQYGRFNYVSPTNTTTYSVTASNGACSSGTDVESVTVTVLPIPVSPIIVATGSSTLTFCDADSILLVSSNFPDSIIWSTGATAQSIWVFQPATYSVSHINTYGCPATKDITLIDPPNPYITGNTTICEGETANLVVQNGLTYSWNTGDTDQSIFVTPNVSTRYYVDITNSSNCTYQDSIDVTVIPVPEITSITQDLTTCSGDSVTLTVDGTALEFIWSTGEIASSINVNPLVTTTYTVNAYNGVGCNQFDDAAVTITTLPLPTRPVITPDQDTIIICEGGAIALTSDITTDIYWSDGATAASVTAVMPGTYVVTHFDNNGCENSDTIVVEFPLEPVLSTNITGTTICEGDAITISASNGDTYLWSTGASTMSITESPLVTTTYYTTITNIQGCNYTKAIEIEVIPATTIVGQVSNMVPADAIGDVAAPIAFSWAPGANATSYDLYVWDATTGQPSTPFVGNLTQINYITTSANSSSLVSGATYNWRVVAKNLCMETPGPIQTLTMRDFPDLTIGNVQAPPTAFSSQNVGVSYEVSNIGNGNTLVQWSDAVYLSADSVLDTNVDFYLGGIANQSFLASGSSYSQSGTVTLPDGVFGLYYFFVVADGFNSIAEADETNNSDFKSPASVIDLTPPPDLQVSNVISPRNVFSGTTVDVSWTTTNEGGGSSIVGTWKDRIYFSEDEVFDENTANFLGDLQHTGVLASGTSYNAVMPVTIPNGIYGKYYFHVEADQNNKVYEYVYEENNVGTGDSINVILTPPTDFVIINTNTPATAGIREPIAVEWTVQNQGGSGPNSPVWIDRVYLTSDSVFLNSPYSKYLGGTSENGTSMLPGETYTRTTTVSIPDNLTGRYYLQIKTDNSNQVYEYINEGNNMVTIPIDIFHPDLTVVNITNPAVDTAGKMIDIFYEVKNVGPVDVRTESWKDQILISNSPVYDDELVEIIGEVSTPTNTLEVDSSVYNQVTVMIPNGYDGTYYLYVDTDYKDRVYEEGDTLNNRIRSNTSIDVTLGPWADLAVTDVTLPDSILAGSTIPMSYIVENMGMADATGGWADDVYLSANPVWVHPDSAIQLTQYLIGATDTLAVDSMYMDTTMIQIPMLQGGLANNTCYVYVFTDGNDAIYERFDTLNNIMGSPVFVTAPEMDLSVRCFMTVTEAMTGDTIPVRWINENLGDYTAFENYWYWYDGLYLSTDTIYDPTDVFVFDWAIFGDSINTNEYVVEGESAVLPENLFGDYYLFMVADHTEITNDIDYNNNATTRILQNVLVRDSSGAPEPITITLRDPSDLTISTFEVPVTGTAGQPIDIVWTITNQGTGPTYGSTWNDKFFLSSDFVLDNDDEVLGNLARIGELAAGASYTDTIQVFLPASAVGNYVVLMKTDVNSVIYEHLAENNNESSSLINIVQPPPSDLIVTSINAPAMAFAGGEITLDWNIKNIGVNPATGVMSEAIYFSEDNVFDVSDVLMTTEQLTINLAPNTEETHTVTASLPGLALGDYYVIVQTDVLNNIFETVDSNNVLASINQVNVDVKELVIDTLENTTLGNDYPIFYQIVVPDSLTGESLLIDLASYNALNSGNEMYLSFGEVPDRSNFDYSHDDIVQGNQDLVVPVLQQGIYYLAVYGGSSASDQTIDLLASILEFEIREVSANVGGDAGSITVKIDGSKFIEGMTAKLDNPALGTIISTDILYIDPTVIYVTFDLNGEALGLYDVILEKPSLETALLQDGFTIETGTGEVLLKNVLHPPNARFNRIVAITIQFTNGGNNDLDIPIRRLVSLRDAPLSFSTSGLQYGIKDLYMEFRELGGPQNVLRPGGLGAYTVYSRANTSQRLRFRILD